MCPVLQLGKSVIKALILSGLTWAVGAYRLHLCDECSPSAIRSQEGLTAGTAGWNASGLAVSSPVASVVGFGCKAGWCFWVGEGRNLWQPLLPDPILCVGPYGLSRETK